MLPRTDSARFRQVMDQLHTWGGLLFGWLLFAIFFTGTLTVFDKEITRWMNPALRGEPAASRESRVSFDQVVEHLRVLAPLAEVWWLKAPSARAPVFTAGWVDPGEPYEERYVDPASGSLVASTPTEGGDFFFEFHFSLLLEEPGWWIVGAAAMAMLVALVTGLIIHRRIFKDFFTFRPDGHPQRGWLDGHNVTSVLALPFHVMITYSGLVIFNLTYLPAGVDAVFGGDEERFRAETFSQLERPASGEPASLVSIDTVAAKARAQWGDEGKLGWIGIHHPEDAAAWVEVRQEPTDRLAYTQRKVTFDGVFGELLQTQGPHPPAFYTLRLLSGLHYVQFGGPLVRWLYFVLGLSGCAMIVTGSILWVKKRAMPRLAQTGIDPAWIDRLNCAGLVGLLVATAAFFWANRLLPVDLPDRAHWEIRLFFLAWGVCTLHALVGRNRRRVWRQQVFAAMGLALIIPVLNSVTTGNHLLAITDWGVAAVDLVALGTAGLLAVIGWRLRDSGARHLTERWTTAPLDREAAGTSPGT